MPNLKTGVLHAGILISCFVAGLIPVLAALVLTSYVPNPGTVTLLPAFNSFVTALTYASNASPASFCVNPALFLYSLI